MSNHQKLTAIIGFCAQQTLKNSKAPVRVPLKGQRFKANLAAAHAHGLLASSTQEEIRWLAALAVAALEYAAGLTEAIERQELNTAARGNDPKQVERTPLPAVEPAGCHPQVAA